LQGGLQLLSLQGIPLGLRMISYPVYLTLK
jgi:hypothetical protein